MFLRPHFRTVDGERRAYWALVESVRTERGPRQRVVAYLGGLDEAGRLGVQQAADVNAQDDRQPSLFEEDAARPRYVTVDVANARVENSRQFGGPWLAWRLIRRLKLDEFLQETIPRGGEEIGSSGSAETGCRNSQGCLSTVPEHDNRIPHVGWAVRTGQSQVSTAPCADSMSGAPGTRFKGQEHCRQAPSGSPESNPQPARPR